MFNLLQSPQITDDSISFYEGDTFSISFNIKLTYSDGTEYNLVESDIIKFKVVRGFDGKEIYNEELTNNTSNVILWTVDEDLSKLFKTGFYKFGMQLVSDNIKTLIPPTEIYVREVI